MGDQRDGGISWTEETWNPIVGCSRVSEGCRHCYAETMAARVANAAQARLQGGGILTDVQIAYCKVVMWERGGFIGPVDNKDKALPKWNGRVAVIESRLAEPLGWSRPRLVFTNSMSDLFHESLADEQIDLIVRSMGMLTNQNTFQVLTKRPERMATYLAGLYADMKPDVCTWTDGQQRFNSKRLGIFVQWPLPNVWWGTSVEDQKTTDERAIHLAACSPHAALLWLSMEPLVGPVELGGWAKPWGGRPTDRLGWVVVGGESGSGARPMNPAWARQLRDECLAAGVAFHFKQWGEWTPGENVGKNKGKVPVVWYRPNRLLKDPWVLGQEDLAKNEGHVDDEPDLYRVGKKAAGRLLDGVQHEALPMVGAAGR